MKKITNALLVAALMILAACGNPEKGFLGSKVFIDDYEKRAPMLQEKGCLAVFDSELSTEQRQALQFLYAYMPLPDVADYSGEFHLMNVDCALKARAEMPWGAVVPDREFLHFVLPVRVNNENLDNSRPVFYNELKERVKNLSMYDAVLEVNHWCHEKVTYTPSDIRTSSPLATVRTAYGRCGEESTFTVAALRSVGIPARQVYTPRWAHTDNNHAWVEAWVDGEWHFLGACEPEPVLDLGWFNAPASRGMLMHTNAFGRYNGPEEVLSVTPCFTEINVTSNYAPVATTNICVVDESDTPVKAKVEFKIYNYAEFFTAATKMCDSEGRASITSGLGDMVAWASYNGNFGFAKFTAGKDSLVKVVVDKAPGYAATFELDIVPPVERNTLPELTPEQVQLNAERFVREDSIRNAYVATFPTAEWSTQFAQLLDAGAEYIVPLIEQSRGNHATITTFLRGVDKSMLNGKALSLLCAISDKDRRDISLEVLNDHFANTPDGSGSLYANYLLNPRVSNEMLTPYKKFFLGVISAEERAAYKKSPSLWVEWCRRNIKVDGEWNPLSLCMSPKGVWQMRIADPHSRDIFFVSGARSMGIISRIDEVTGKTQYMGDDGKWCDVNFDEDSNAVATPQGSVKSTFAPTKFIDNPKYYSHYSISKIVDGQLQLLVYPEERTTWQSMLKNGERLDVGNYFMMTGTRMANGGVLAHLTFFNVEEEKETVLDYVLRESEDELSVIGDFNSENLFFDLSTNQQRSILSATGRGYYIIALVDPNSEPTNHFLRDVMPYKEQFEQWGKKMVLLFKDGSAAKRFKSNDFPSLPSTVVWGTDINDKIYNEIVANMKLKSPNKPVILVADTFNRVVFMSQGYSIGLGEQLIKVINKLANRF